MAKYRHFAGLVIQTRRELGYNTSRKCHNDLNDPPIEYQSWTHIEAGRRLPRPETALAIADSLKIPKGDALLAYMRDLFQDCDSQEIIDTLKQYLVYMKTTTLKRAETLGSEWHSLTTPQWQAVEKDPELFRLISSPFRNDRIHIQDLGVKLGWPIPKVIAKVQTLVQHDLLEFYNEFVLKIYRGVRVPILPETLALRKSLLMQNIDSGLSEKTSYTNWIVNLTEDGQKDLLNALSLVDAKCCVNHEDSKKTDFAKAYNVITYFNPL